MQSLPVSRALAVVLLLLWPVPSRAQEGAVAVTTPVWSHRIRSGATGRDYRLIVSVPDSYWHSDTAHYAVLYVLDGNDEFPLAVQTLRKLRAAHALPELIVIGVGYAVGFSDDPTGFRWADYTPTPDPKADVEWEAKRSNRQGATLQSGDGPRFLAALKTEIIPFIEARYRTTTDRGLWGHSLGALFGVYAMLTEPGLFRRYAISSPSLWWNSGDTFALEAAFARSHPALNVRAFLSVGGNEEREMIAGVDSLTHALASRRYPGFAMTAQTFKGADHATVVQGALSASLRFLYADVPRR